MLALPFPLKVCEQKYGLVIIGNFYQQQNVLLVSLIKWILNSENSEKFKLRVVFEAILCTKTLNLQHLGKCCSGSLAKDFLLWGTCYFSIELATGLEDTFSSECSTLVFAFF